MAERDTLIDEIDQLIPEAAGSVRLAYEDHGKIEIVATQGGLMRMGIEFLKLASDPEVSTSAVGDSRLGQTLAPSIDPVVVRIEVFDSLTEATTYPEPQAHSNDFLGRGLRFALLYVIASALVGTGYFISLLF